MQNTDTILMIRPAAFTFNAETAANNYFQVAGNTTNAQQKALQEFDDFVEKLKANNINVLVINDTPEPHTPDSIFPNNWVSFHENNTMVLYPMFAKNRRAERKQHVKDFIAQHLKPLNIVDLTYFENENLFLEGTGSMVLDRENKIAYACLSERTNEKVLDVFCNEMHYTKCCFSAKDKNGNDIYHTNVMMCVADKYVVICLESVSDEDEKHKLESTIKNTAKTIIEISLKQMNQFAGNMLQVKNTANESILIMSQQALNCLSTYQVDTLITFNKIISADLSSIETNGGGSARCMLAEIFK